MTKKYVAVARKMKAYEEEKYAAWRANLENTLMTYLKKNLLIKSNPASANTRVHGVADEEKAAEVLDGSTSLAAVDTGR